MIPTRRLAAVAAVVGVALLFYPGELVGGVWGTLAIVNGVLAMIALLDGLAAPRPALVEVTRDFPPVVVLGTDAEWRWRIVNQSGRRMKVRVADELAASLGARRRRVATRRAAACRDRGCRGSDMKAARLLRSLPPDRTSASMRRREA